MMAGLNTHTISKINIIKKDCQINILSANIKTNLKSDFLSFIAIQRKFFNIRQ